MSSNAVIVLCSSTSTRGAMSSLGPAGNPDQGAALSPEIVAVSSTVDPSPDPDPPSSSTVDATPRHLDVPGPSTTFIPRQPSPPLPDLSHRPFPPVRRSRSSHRHGTGEGADEDEGEADEDEGEADEPDEVVAQLPIYLSPAMYPNLHLFQYPLHHADLGVTDWASARGKIVSARVKEAVGRIEVEIPVKTEGKVWRDERARELGYVTDVNAVNGSNGDGIDGGRRGRKKDLPKWGDKMRLRGEVVPEATGYYSGVIRDGALHLHPVSKISQFRTSLTYLDDYNARNHSTTQAADEEEKRKRAALAAKTPAQKLRDEEKDGSGSLKDFREKMVGTALREEEDTWVPYSWRAGDNDNVLDRLDRLVVPEDKRARLRCATNGLDYLDRDV